MTRRTFLKGCLSVLIIVVIGGVMVLRHHIVINVGESMPGLRYLCLPKRPYTLGDVVLLQWPEPQRTQIAAWTSGAVADTPCLKRLMGMEAMPMCWAPLDAPVQCRPLKAHEVFVMGEHRESLDSQLLGPLPTSAILATCWRIW